ncbi:MAG: MYXO-CTERM sorting domain-containing protein [Polyangiaceae bacterium]|nr:MYXO-CTERM sorting domain-containing protein [Polyangiaceae bacterium]
MTSFDDWGFSEFWDVMPVADTALAAITEDAALPDNPLLVQSDDGSPEVWVIDGEVRRHVPDPAAFDTWGFDSAAIVKWAAKDLEALPVGPKLRSRPVLVRGSGSEIYLMDDALPKPAPAGSGGSGGTGGSGAIDPSGGSGSKTAAGPGQKTKVLSEDAEGGCACRTTGSAPSSGFGALALLGLGLVAARRRRVRA